MLARIKAKRSAEAKKRAKASGDKTPRKPRIAKAINSRLQAVLAKYPPEMHEAIIASMKGTV